MKGIRRPLAAMIVFIAFVPAKLIGLGSVDSKAYASSPNLQRVPIDNVGSPGKVIRKRLGYLGQDKHRKSGQRCSVHAVADLCTNVAY